MDEGGKKSARTPNLKSEFQTINEDDEFKKNETKAKNNIKTKLLSRLQDKNDWNIKYYKDLSLVKIIIRRKMF